MTRPARVWTALKALIDDPDVLADNIRVFFKRAANESLGELSALQEAQKLNAQGISPSFASLDKPTQDALRHKVYKQYSSLPQGEDVQRLLQEGFNMIFKGKVNYKKDTGSELKFFPLIYYSTHNPLAETSDPEASQSSRREYTYLKRLATLIANLAPQLRHLRHPVYLH
jgi:hypothetical protein